MTGDHLPAACATAVAALLVLDGLWMTLGGTGERFRAAASQIGDIRPWETWKTLMFATGAYVLLASSSCFILSLDKSILKSLVAGLLAGLIIYGVFDLTNLCVFGKGYPLGLAIADVCWGVFLLGFSTLVGAVVREWRRMACVDRQLLGLDTRTRVFDG